MSSPPLQVLERLLLLGGDLRSLVAPQGWRRARNPWRLQLRASALRCHLLVHDASDGGKRKTRLLSDRPVGLAFFPQSEDQILFFVGALRATTKVSTHFPAVFNRLLGPLLDQRLLDLGKTGKESDYQWCHLLECLDIDYSIQGFQMDAFLPEVIQSIDDLDLGAPQSVQLGNDK